MRLPVRFWYSDLFSDKLNRIFYLVIVQNETKRKEWNPRIFYFTFMDRFEEESHMEREVQRSRARPSMICDFISVQRTNTREKKILMTKAYGWRRLVSRQQQIFNYPRQQTWQDLITHEWNNLTVMSHVVNMIILVFVCHCSAQRYYYLASGSVMFHVKDN